MPLTCLVWIILLGVEGSQRSWSTNEIKGWHVILWFTIFYLAAVHSYAGLLYSENLYIHCPDISCWITIRNTLLSSLFTWSWILLEVLCAIYLFHATHVLIIVLVFITEANEGPVWSADSCVESREARSPNEDKAGIFQTWECWCYEVIFHCSGAWFLIVSRVILLLGK